MGVRGSGRAIQAQVLIKKTAGGKFYVAEQAFRVPSSECWEEATQRGMKG